MEKTNYEEPIIMRQTPIILLFKFIFIVILFNLFFIITSLIYAYLRQYYWIPLVREYTVFMLLFIIEVLIFMKIIIYWLSEYMYITESIILHKKWLFNTKEYRYSLDKINNIEIKQNFVWKLLRYWDIHVCLTSEQIAIFSSIPYPNQFVFLLEQKIKLSRNNSLNKNEK